jgi:hypothetical protein
MTIQPFPKQRRPIWMAVIVTFLVAAILSFPASRNWTQRLFRSLRVQKVQAVNVDLSAFVGPNANSTLQQMVAQMISDKVNVTANEKDQSASDAAAASQLAGFHVQLLSKRKDSPNLTVAGEHALTMTVDRGRLQAIFNEAGHPDLVLPQALDGAAVAVQIPRSVRAQYGNCPGPANATNAIAGNLTSPPPASTQYSDCVRLSEGPSPIVNVPSSLDVAQLAEIGLEVAGMSPTQAHEFLQTVDWKATLGLSVPRFLRSYEAVKVNGAQGTLLTMAGRRGPGYTLIWVKNGIVYSLVGFGDSGEAVGLADSLK